MADPVLLCTASPTLLHTNSRPFAPAPERERRRGTKSATTKKSRDRRTVLNLLIVYGARCGVLSDDIAAAVGLPADNVRSIVADYRTSPDPYHFAYERLLDARYDRIVIERSTRADKPAG
jgi:hypothetical protein